ncbi:MULTISPECIES: hypothetical protein [Pseudomonas]|uniref:hypothetical protein n=1 Tax=Pseudomonas TaxID=286 RepID=UPI00111437D0|nr:MULTISPECIES: hypothetical protein [Pseudomonas]
MAKTIAVSVNKDGTIYKNPTEGITSTYRVQAGIYVVEYQGQFSDVPVVVASQNYPSWNAGATQAGRPTDNAVIVSIDENRAIILTGNSDFSSKGPSPEDRNFTAIIIGPSY